MEPAYDRAGPAGGFPVLLVHGWPETRRIWARNVEALAAAGFDVIAPDLRGFGDSPPADRYDLAAHARDLRELLDRLALESCACVGGDLGGGVIVDLGLRFPGTVVRQGRDADAPAAELRTPEERRRYVATFRWERADVLNGAVRAFLRDLL